MSSVNKYFPLEILAPYNFEVLSERVKATPLGAESVTLTGRVAASECPFSVNADDDEAVGGRSCSMRDRGHISLNFAFNACVEHVIVGSSD